MTLPPIQADLNDYTPKALKQFVKNIMLKREHSPEERDQMIIAKQLYFEKTGIPLSQHELIKN